MDRFALMPLAKQVVFNGDWLDDGVQASVYSEGDGWLWQADAGLWRGQVFPSAQGASPAPSLHLGLMRGDWRSDVFAVSMHPTGRGALVANGNGAHTHAAPQCDATRSGVLCFNGDSLLAGGSLEWVSHDVPISIQTTVWMRDDTGQLSSVNGLAQHSGRYRGGWLQAMWKVRDAIEVGARAERIGATLELNGAGASLLATEAGFTGSSPIQRHTAMAAWQALPELSLSMEVGVEKANTTNVEFVIFRGVWRWGHAFDR